MTRHDQRSALLSTVTRTLRPTWGARRNAADALRDVRHDRDQRAEAAAAFARSASRPSGGRPD